MIKHLVFDFGGVILDLDGVHTGYPDNLAVIFDISIAEAKKLWDQNKTSVITGKETPKEFLARMKKEHDFAFEIEQGINYWEEKNIIAENRIDWELLELIKKWHSEYQIHMLTDQIQLKNGASAWIDKVDGLFDTILRSYEQGYRKPFTEAYKNLLEKIGATHEPNSVLFIDDNQENIEAAQKMGIQGVLYQFRNHNSIKDRLLS